MKIEVGITTHNRPDKCLFLLHQIADAGVHVTVMHDYCGSDYSKVIDFCKENGWAYFVTSEKLGKWGFYRLNNFLYEAIEELDFDYFIQLPDDALLVENFFERATSLVENDDCVALFTTIGQVKKFSKLPIVRRSGVPLFEGNFLDCCFITTKEVMRGFRVEQNWRSVKQNVLKSSGVGKEQTAEYNRKTGRKALNAHHALVVDYSEYGGDTVMHHPKYMKLHHTGRKKFSLLRKDRDFIKQKNHEFIRFAHTPVARSRP